MAPSNLTALCLRMHKLHYVCACTSYHVNNFFFFFNIILFFFSSCYYWLGTPVLYKKTQAFQHFRKRQGIFAPFYTQFCKTCLQQNFIRGFYHRPPQYSDIKYTTRSLAHLTIQYTLWQQRAKDPLIQAISTRFCTSMNSMLFITYLGCVVNC